MLAVCPNVTAHEILLSVCTYYIHCGFTNVSYTFALHPNSPATLHPFPHHCQIVSLLLYHIAYCVLKSWYSKEPSVVTTGLWVRRANVHTFAYAYLLSAFRLYMSIYACMFLCVRMRLKFSKIIFRMLALRIHLIVLLIWRSMNKMVCRGIVGTPFPHWHWNVWKWKQCYSYLTAATWRHSFIYAYASLYIYFHTKLYY